MPLYSRVSPSMPFRIISPLRSAPSRPSWVRSMTSWSEAEEAKKGLNLPSKPVSARTRVPSEAAVLDASAVAVLVLSLVASDAAPPQPASTLTLSAAADASAMTCLVFFMCKTSYILPSSTNRPSAPQERKARKAKALLCCLFLYSAHLSTVT